ncbi:MAG: flavodoxin domain-containing protein [Actinomycetota bacterium]|nr:flavodoxin domain-containing protein [Actinomycetota bacterium]
MRMLVTYASKYGATEEIAARIARTLDAAGHRTTVRPIGGDLGRYDAYVIGSAVYLRKWLSGARKAVRRSRVALAGSTYGVGSVVLSQPRKNLSQSWSLAVAIQVLSHDLASQSR